MRWNWLEIVFIGQFGFREPFGTATTDRNPGYPPYQHTVVRGVPVGIYLTVPVSTAVGHAT